MRLEHMADYCGNLTQEQIEGGVGGRDGQRDNEPANDELQNRPKRVHTSYCNTQTAEGVKHA